MQALHPSVAQELMAALAGVMNEPVDAAAYWSSAADLKQRFNRDWWVEEGRCFALALDPDKRPVTAAGGPRSPGGRRHGDAQLLARGRGVEVGGAAQVEQVMVITGASSGIGLVTAKQAAAKGAAHRQIREIIAGGSGAMLSAARFAPGTADLYMERFTFDGQKTDTPASPDRPHNLFEPVSSDGGERGSNWEGHTRESSVYTKAMLHPAAQREYWRRSWGSGCGGWDAGPPAIDRPSTAGYPELSESFTGAGPMRSSSLRRAASRDARPSASEHAVPRWKGHTCT